MYYLHIYLKCVILISKDTLFWSQQARSSCFFSLFRALESCSKPKGVPIWFLNFSHKGVLITRTRCLKIELIRKLELRSSDLATIERLSRVIACHFPAKSFKTLYFDSTTRSMRFDNTRAGQSYVEFGESTKLDENFNSGETASKDKYRERQDRNSIFRRDFPDNCKFPPQL